LGPRRCSLRLGEREWPPTRWAAGRNEANGDTRRDGESDGVVCSAVSGDIWRKTARKSSPLCEADCVRYGQSVRGTPDEL